MRWTGAEPAHGSGKRAAALSFYLTMMTDTCLSFTGADGPMIVEGPFAHNPTFMQMLAVATGRPVWQGDAKTGTALGAALLFSQAAAPSNAIAPEPAQVAGDWSAYAAKWRAPIA